MLLKNLEPSVPKRWLFAMAGLMWSAVGAALCRTAVIWLQHESWQIFLSTALLASGSATVAYFFGFSKIAKKNIKRIHIKSGNSCIFAFQAWKGYLMVGLMILIGAGLRNSPIPKPYLAFAYATIGGALFLASGHYYSQFLQLRRQED
ncbi:hypothetical protein ACFLZM_06310 [Thermodesulfobacteriota bacterium]